MRMGTGLVLLAVAGLVFAAAAPALAADPPWRGAIRYSIADFAPTSDYKASWPGGGELKTVFQNTWGAGIAYEARFSDLVGIEVAAKYFKPQVRVIIPGESGEKRLKVLPLTLGPMFHFGGEVYKFYFGPELVYVNYGEISAPATPDHPGPVPFKNELTWGGKLGVDIPFSDAWAFNATIEYLDAKAEVDEPGGKELTPRPVIVTVGAAFRF